ncbi:hypothetical protein Cme02nite_38270 [Catellatospora methionotrophica]|uniref:ATP-dependent Clp protease proteolytic subunit n=1 Tax=Catellatospora methionotrophica TaxID=121620 RepID=A0A8J3LMQ9_9ACTN|nr:head maturation protease, ClpP-related [Catellatospora methionotrophica]GIG15495.1 hypothetical protein Cme02nite_38270 [Catellatospora methionotrophica]
MKRTPRFFVAAVALQDRLAGKYDPSQRRDSDGKWSDDALGLSDRITLNDGERLLGSRKGSVTESSTSTPVLASIGTDSGTELRIGVVAVSDASKWAGANRGGTAKLDQAAVDNLNAAIDVEVSKAKTRQREIQKLWEDIEDAQAEYETAYDADADAEAIRAARAKVEAAEAAEAAYFENHDIDDLIGEGVVAGSSWGDIAFQIWGDDDEQGGWYLDLAVKPHGADDWSWDDVIGYEKQARLDLSNWRTLQRQMKTLMALGDDAAPSNSAGRGAMRGRRGRAQARSKASGAADFRVENRAGDVAEIYLYSEIGGWGVTAAQFVQELAQVKAPTVDLHINSPGGDAFDGVAIYNALVASKKRINVHVDGLAASIASVIAMAGSTVTMGRGSQMMIHDAHGFAVGNVDAMRAYIELLDRTSADIAGFYAGKAGGTAAEWRTRMKAETWYSAEEAVKAGLADDVAAVQTMEQVAADWDLSVFNFAGRTRAPAPSVARVEAAAAREGRAAEVPAQQPAEPPAEVPVEVPAFDPAVFKASMTAALDPMPGFDPAQFRDTMGALALDAPAAPTPVRAAAEEPPAAEPEPEPEPAELAIGGYTPSVFQAAMRLAANTLAAPDVPPPAPAPADEPLFPAIDPTSFVRSLKEATL